MILALSSIEDQISSCRHLAKENGHGIVESYIYPGYALSVSPTNHDGVNELLAVCGNHEFNVVLVDDLSRLARDNFLILSVISDRQFQEIRIVSVTDGLDSNDDESKLGIQIPTIEMDNSTCKTKSESFWRKSLRS